MATLVHSQDALLPSHEHYYVVDVTRTFVDEILGLETLTQASGSPSAAQLIMQTNRGGSCAEEPRETHRGWLGDS